jgi:probable HAF family extracellular repeat protein
VLSDLGTLGGSSAKAFGINSLGQVVGTSALPGDTASHATLWTNGTKTDLGTLIPPPNNGSGKSQAYGINDAGQVVGAASRPCDVANPCGTVPEAQAAFIHAGGVMTAIGPAHSGATGINNTGQITGYLVEAAARGVVFWSSSASALTRLFGSPSVFGQDPLTPLVGINGAGQVVASRDSNRAVIWDKGAITDLGALYNSCEGGLNCRSGAIGINASGQVVGFIGRGSGGSPVAPEYVDNRAALWTNGKVFDLNTLLDPGSPISPYALRYAIAINDSGLIVAVGYVVDATNPFKDTGLAHTFLLSPIP